MSSQIGTGLTPSDTLVVKASAGSLLSFQVTNRSPSTVYVFLVDKATAVSGGDTPKGCPIPVPPSSQIELGVSFFTTAGWQFGTGISIGVSSSNTTYTPGTAADHDILATYA
jgi:hypothetical protein